MWLQCCCEWFGIHVRTVRCTITVPSRECVELFITYCIPHLLLVCELRAAAEESTSLFREAIAALDIKSKGI